MAPGNGQNGVKKRAWELNENKESGSASPENEPENILKIRQLTEKRRKSESGQIVYPILLTYSLIIESELCRYPARLTRSLP